MTNLLNLNIQFFAADQKTTYAGYEDQVENAQAFLDRDIQKAVYDNFDLAKYLGEKKVPKNQGHTLKIMKWGRYKAKVNPYFEGAVITPDDPMARYEFKLSLKDYKGYTTYSDLVDIYDISNGVATRLAENQMASLGEVLDYKTYQTFLSSKNHYFAGVEKVESTLSATRDKLTAFNLDDLSQIRASLVRQKVKPFDGKNYLMIISPEVEKDLLTLKKSTASGSYTFVEVANAHQKSDKVYDGSLGEFMGFKFITSNAITKMAETSTGKAIHGCLVLGTFNNERGAVAIKLEGEGKLKSIIKPITAGGARENPTNDIGSVGWALYGYGQAILYPEAVMVYECLADAPVEAVKEVERENFVGGTDGKGGTVEAGNYQYGLFDGVVVTLAESNGTRNVNNLGTFLVKKGDTITDTITVMNDAGLTYGDGTAVNVVNVYRDVKLAEQATGSETLDKNTVVYIQAKNKN